MAAPAPFDLYDAGGYGHGKIGFGRRIGIVSVDFMNGVTNPKARMGQSPMQIECMREWIIGSWLVQVDERLWRDGDVLVCKKTPSIFFGTHRASVLNSHGVDTVIVTGANTSGCIRATAIESFALGYRTIVPRECVLDQGSVAHEQNLRDIGMRNVDVEPCETVLSQVRAAGRVAATKVA